MKVISVRCLEGETSVGGRMRMSVSRLDPKQPEAKPRDLSARARDVFACLPQHTLTVGDSSCGLTSSTYEKPNSVIQIFTPSPRMNIISESWSLSRPVNCVG